MALGRKNYLFVGNDAAGENLAGLSSLIATCEANGINPEAYLADVLLRLSTHPASELDALLPHRWSPHQPLTPPDLRRSAPSVTRLAPRTLRVRSQDAGDRSLTNIAHSHDGSPAEQCRYDRDYDLVAGRAERLYDRLPPPEAPELGSA